MVKVERQHFKQESLLHEFKSNLECCRFRQNGLQNEPKNTPRFTPLQGSVDYYSKTIKNVSHNSRTTISTRPNLYKQKKNPLSMHFRDDIQIASMLIHLPAKLLTAAAADFVTGFGSSVTSSDMGKWTVS